MEAAISTTDVIHQWKALLKLKFWTPLFLTAEKYLILDTSSTEILVPKLVYGSEKLRDIYVLCRSLSLFTPFRFKAPVASPEGAK